jgi:hypothetical protein
MTDANPNKLLSGIVASAALEVERRLGGYLPQVGSGEGDWGIPPQGERLLRHAKQFEAGSFTSSNRLFGRDQRSPMERGLGGYLPQVGCPKLSRRLPRSAKRPEQAKECGASASPLEAGFGAPGGIRIPNLLIRRESNGELQGFPLGDRERDRATRTGYFSLPSFPRSARLGHGSSPFCTDTKNKTSAVLLGPVGAERRGPLSPLRGFSCP